MSSEKKEIIAKMVDDWASPYDELVIEVLLVIESNHPKFIVGTTLDWGFIQVALKDGYTVTIQPRATRMKI